VSTSFQQMEGGPCTNRIQLQKEEFSRCDCGRVHRYISNASPTNALLSG